jgi:hypothetical protein
VTTGKTFPKDIIERWPEVFGEITLNVIPLRYLESVTVTFKNKKIWEINMASRRVREDWDSFESSLKEMLAAYESEIENVDFKLDTERVKKDMIKNTNKFLKRKKLR